MQLLKMPPKMPFYRAERSHKNFLFRLNTHFTSPVAFLKHILEAFSLKFSLEEKALNHVTPFLNLSHRKSTTIYEFSNIPS